jgi:ribosomal protein S18 acetylase RimI-like enzyme
MSSVELRAAREEDEAFLLDVYASTRADELAQVGWPEDAKAAFVASQHAAQSAHYRGGYPDAAFDVIVVDGVPVGRLYVSRGRDEIRVMDLALLPAWRGRGVGSALLRDLAAEARTSGKKLTVHVEKLNRARELYERIGFVEADDVGTHVLLELRTEPATS